MTPLPTIAVAITLAMRQCVKGYGSFYAKGEHYSSGWCYAASEVAYNLLGGKKAGWKPMRGKGNAARHTDPECRWNQHWWLQGPNGEVLDLTRRQYATKYPYQIGRGCGFMTPRPSFNGFKLINQIRSNGVEVKVK